MSQSNEGVGGGWMGSKRCGGQLNEALLSQDIIQMTEKK